MLSKETLWVKYPDPASSGPTRSRSSVVAGAATQERSFPGQVTLRHLLDSARVPFKGRAMTSSPCQKPLNTAQPILKAPRQYFREAAIGWSAPGGPAPWPAAAPGARRQSAQVGMVIGRDGGSALQQAPRGWRRLR